MHSYRLIQTGLIVCASTAALVGCKPAATPELQTTTGVQQLQEPVTVAGCLKSGVADNTFVLTTVEGSTGTATYQLVARADQNLKGHVGELVEISGTLRAREEVEGTSGQTPEKPAKNAAGTPVVETKTDLDFRQLNVDAIKPSGDRCAAP